MADNTANSAASSGTLPAASSTGNTQPATQSDAVATSQAPATSTEDANLGSLPDRDLDAEINAAPATTSNADGMNVDGANDASQGKPNTTTATTENDTDPLGVNPAVLETRIPQKKDTSLREFLGKMDDYAPLIPDAVTDYYMTVAGLPPPPETDRRLARLLALATQKFIADVAADAYQYSRIRSTNTTSNNPLTGLGGAAGFGMTAPPPAGDADGAGKGKKDAGKSQPLGGPRAGYGGGGAGAAQGRTVLTMEDLGMAVGEYGVNVKRGEFYR